MFKCPDDEQPLDYAKVREFYFIDHNQSGTKPNLIAKNSLPNLVTVLHRLPKLVANISSQFRHR